MTFARPEFLFGLILLPLAGLLLLWTRRRRDADLARLGSPTLVKRLSRAVNWRGRRWRDALWLVVIALTIVALARPQWGTVERMVEQEGIEVMVALDVSQSMLAQDIKPDRLSRAKMEIADLMGRLGGNEIGLVLFSGASFIQFPLTSDYATARSFLDNARPEVISRPGTAIGQAIRTAMAGFDMNRSSQKVIVLITDGENHDGGAVAMAEQAASQGIMIYTIGFGSAQGEPIPQYDAQGGIVGYKQDAQGEVVLSKLDEAQLQQVANVGGGQYYRATPDGSELAALVDELDTLQRAELNTLLETDGIERYQAFLILALVALVAAELIPDRVQRKPVGKRAAMRGKWSTASGE